MMLFQKRHSRPRFQAKLLPVFGLVIAGFTVNTLSNNPVFAQSGNGKTSWTDSSGTKTVEAEFVKLNGVNLVLRKADGKEITLPLSKLDDKSRLKARTMAKNSSPKPAGNDTLLAGPSSSTTAAPATTLAISSNIPKPVEFPSNLTAQEFADIISAEFKKENALVVWDALPPAKQQQIQELVRLAASKVEQKTFDKIKQFRSDIVGALRNKKSFVLNSKLIPIPPDQKSLLVNSYDAIVDLVEAYVPSEMLDSSNLQNANLRDLVGNYLENLKSKSNALVNTLPADSSIRALATPKQPEIKLDNVSANEVTVSLVVNGQPPSPPLRFIQSEGRWLPADMVAGWEPMMAQVTQVLQTVDPKVVHRGVTQALNNIAIPLGSFTGAETQEDFDSAIQLVMSMAQGMQGMGTVNAGGPMAQGVGPGAGSPSVGGGPKGAVGLGNTGTPTNVGAGVSMGGGGGVGLGNTGTPTNVGAGIPAGGIGLGNTGTPTNVGAGIPGGKKGGGIGLGNTGAPTNVGAGIPAGASLPPR